MPVQRVYVNGMAMFRWGNRGRLYHSKEEAEAVGKAIHASKAKEKAKKRNDK